jgi:hypothetical protein
VWACERRHTLGDGVVDNNTLTAAGATRVRAAAQRPARFADLNQHAVFVITFGGAVTSNAWAAIGWLEGGFVVGREATGKSGEMG